MTTLLVTISLLLHAFTFLWILTLIKQQQARPSSKDEEKRKQEIEDLLISYTLEMKEENEKLLRQLSKDHEKEMEKDKPVQTRTAETVMPSRVVNHKEQKEEDKYKDYLPPMVEDSKEVEFQQSETANIISLSRQGYSAEEIAQKLNLGKGEVELMLKFYR
ncbi:hypothetical protein JCM9140_193 [Halalkalibacter wakoensis JCM 9140]|uniref:Swarming motility protein SwrB n=1 Tax=Halalkalibacter wakoensis JCM 9140 TaxID=1236970 RepID=W4PX59_9BACI|nr:hypothetical protein [Halalkalibacter wakoensis]GAE24280.1 hypothetical protein JCM9140_193 [Halalkalibacter wakoensis JCM 9140]